VVGAPVDSSGQSQATATVTNNVTNEENTYFVGDTVIRDGDTADIALTDCDTGETVTVTVPVYRISAQITYDANGGQGAPAAQEKILGVDLMISEQEPEREGYRFTGWGTDPNGEPVFQPGDWYAEDADMALYALWEPENLGGHIVADIEHIPGTVLAVDVFLVHIVLFRVVHCEVSVPLAFIEEVKLYFLYFWIVHCCVFLISYII
jgi:uncharacterized repeat protein (TIGR02543 family)